MKRRLQGVGVWLLLVLLTGCMSQPKTEQIAQQPGQETEREEDSIRIGMIFDTFVVERWLRDRDAFLSTASELGASVDITNANGSVARQEEMIRYYIKEKMDAIVLVAIDSKPLKQAIKAAREAGVPVISYDRLVRDAGTDLYVSFDSTQVGRLMAKGIAQQLDPGDKVLLLLGPTSDNNTNLMETGMKEVLSEYDVEIADIAYIVDWDAEEAVRYVETHIESIREVDGILCGNDNFAGSVIRTLSANRIELPLIAGQDADVEACQRIVEGTQYMTVYKPVHFLAKEAAKSAVALAKDESIVYDTLLDDGTFQVKARLLLPREVTKENMEDTVIASGFHTKAEVYLNVR